MDVVPCVRESLSFRILLRFYTPVMGVPGGEVTALHARLPQNDAGRWRSSFSPDLALSELSNRNREAFCLPVDAGCCYRESVERTGCSPTAVRVHQVIEWITVPPPISTFPYCMIVPAKASKCSHCIPWVMC